MSSRSLKKIVEKNDKGVTVVNRAGLVKLEEIYKTTIFEDEPVSEEVKQRELMEILVDERNAEILRLYDQLKAKDKQLAEKDEQLPGSRTCRFLRRTNNWISSSS